MNYKLFSVICCIFAMNFFVYSSDRSMVVHHRPDAIQHQQGDQGFVHRVLHDNFAIVDRLEAEHRELSLQHREVVTSLKHKTDDLAETKATLENQRKAFLERIETYLAETRQMQNAHAAEKLQMQQEAARNQAQMLTAHAEEKLQMQASHHRDIALTFAGTAVSTWAFCKITSETNFMSNIFQSITKRMAGSKP